MSKREIFSPIQCRAARGLLDWTTEQLASAARLESEAVELYERGDGELSRPELATVGRALSAAGVVAIPECLAGEGVQLRQPCGAAPETPSPIVSELHHRESVASFGLRSPDEFGRTRVG